MNETSSRWYVVQTHVYSEAKAAHHLARQGFEVYLPRYRKRRRHARRIDIVAAPLFPRYVFVAIDENSQRWRAIQSTVGVAHLVCSGEQPATMAAAIVDGLRSREDDVGFVRLERRVPFAPGARVRVIDGAFEDALGLFDGMADRDRVSILLELLGRKVRIQLDVGFCHRRLIAAGYYGAGGV